MSVEDRTAGETRALGRARRERWIARVLGALVLLAGVLVALAALGTSSVPIPVADVRVASHFLFWIAGGLALLGAGLAFASAKVSLAAATLVYTVLGLFAVSYRPAGVGSVTYARSAVEEPGAASGEPASGNLASSTPAGIVRRTTMGEDHWFEEHLVFDERYATMGVPNGRRRYHHPDFDVVMSYDEEGWRIVPGPGRGSKSAEEIWFLGCSFTFGFGVADDESFAAVLAREAWTDFRVRVFAHGGWGTTNSFLVLSDKLAQGPPPVAVFYGWISHHAERNSASSAWNRKVKYAFPFISLERDRLVKHGIICPERGDALPQVPIDETALSVALIREMARLCREKGVSFFVLAFEANDPVIPALRSDSEVAVLEVWQQVTLERLPRDGHPTRLWHRKIASTLAADSSVAEQARRPGLYRPERVPPPPPHWFLSNDSLGGFTAVLHPADGMGNQWRVDQISANADNAFKIGINREGFAIQEGCEYTLRFRHRADSPRPAYLAISKAQRGGNAGRNIGLWLNLDVDTQWRTHESRFIAQASADAASLGIWLSQSTAPVEMADFELWNGERNLLQVPTNPAANEASAGTR